MSYEVLGRDFLNFLTQNYPDDKTREKMGF